MPHDEFGREIPDQTPVQMPLGFRRPKPLNEVVQELIRNELSRQAADSGQETFDEANDFDAEDEEFPVSPHELLDDEEEFRYAEQNMLDRAAKDMDNVSTVDKDRVKDKETKDGPSKGGSGSGGSADAENGNADVRKGLGSESAK